MSASSTAASIEPGLEWQVYRFADDDADGVVSLFRSVYGEGYPVRTYLEPALLIAENTASRTISSVAKTSRGDVVGHNALFNSAPHPGTYESGAGVVHATYRGGKGIFTALAAHGLELAPTLPQVDLVFGEPVCNHPFSQKLMHRLNFVSRALEVDLMPAAAYTTEASATGRVAAFIATRTFRSKPQTLFLPEAYRQELLFCYQEFDDQRDFATAGDVIPVGSATELQPQIFDFAAVARVPITAVGADFAERIAALEEELAARRIIVSQLWLRLDCPWLGEAVDILRQRGYFLGGALPRWFDVDGLLMQKIGKNPDWEGICTIADREAEILRLVRADWQRSLEWAFNTYLILEQTYGNNDTQ